MALNRNVHWEVRPTGNDLYGGGFNTSGSNFQNLMEKQYGK